MKAGLVHLVGGVSILAAAVSIFSTNAAATGVCYDPWSMGGSTQTIGPVCGDIKIQGGGDGGPMSVSLDHPTPVSGTSVTNSGGGGGSGIGALVALSGSYGTGHIQSSAFTPPQNGSASYSSSARGYIGTIDGFTVGAHDLSAQFTLSLEGAFTGGGYGESIFRLEDQTTNQFVIQELKADADQSQLTDTVSQTAFLSAGHSYIFTWGMAAIADARVDFFSNHPDVSADLSNTGHLFIDVLTAGESLTFNSGYNYASNATAVTPLPPSWMMMLTSLGGLGFLAFRRKSPGTLGTA